MAENYGGLGAFTMPLFNEQGQINTPTQDSDNQIDSNSNSKTLLGSVLELNQKIGREIYDVVEPLTYGATVGLTNINRLVPGATWLADQAGAALEHLGVEHTIPKPEGIVGEVSSGLGQVLPAIIPLVRLLKTAGWSSAGADIIGGFFGDAVTSGKKDADNIMELVSGLAGSIPGENAAAASNALSDFVKSDNVTFEELKSRLVSAIPGAVFTPIVNGVARYAMKVKSKLVTGDLLSSMKTRWDKEQSPIPMGLSIEDVSSSSVRDISTNPQGFYSAVTRAVDTLPMEKGGGDQMRSMIAKGEGVRAEEMAWTGLDDFLAGKKSVTKAEIKEFTDANQVRVEEVVKSEPDISTMNRQAMQDIEESLDEGQVLDDDALNAMEGWLTATEYGNKRLARQYEALLEEKLSDAGDMRSVGDFTRSARDDYEDSSTPKWGEYTLPGGKNYREVLLTLPENKGFNVTRYEELKQKDIAGKLNDLEEVKEFNTLIDRKESGVFTQGHYDEPNVLAHIRLNDRTGPDGERILFVEEIQSDWHQMGREKGYQTPERFTEPFQVIPETEGNYILYEVRDANGEFITNVGSAIAENADQAVVVAQGRIRDQTGVRVWPRVPDAPLKKTWEQTALRRVIRIAAEEGYDSVSWTAGKTQIDRYEDSLRRNVDEVTYEPVGDGTYNMAAEKGGSIVHDVDGLTLDEIQDLYGKDIAGKIEKDTGSFGERPLRPDLKVLTGDDLSIGGEGMKGFYDKKLVNYANKFGKKFDAKVGATKIQNGVLESKEAWTIPITPKMRDSVMKKGVPLFSAGALATSAAMQDQDSNGL